MRRRFLEFAIGFAAAALFCVYLIQKSAVMLIIIFAVIIVFLGIIAEIFSATSYYIFIKSLIAIMSGALLCAVIFQINLTAINRAVETLDGINTQRNIYVCGFSETLGTGQRIEAKIEDDSGKSICKAVIYYYSGEIFTPGDKISAELVLSKPEGSKRLYSLSKGIYVTGTITGNISFIENGKVKPSNLHLYIRKTADKGVDRLFGKKSYFIRGLLFGDKTGFDDSFFIKASDVGISHIFAVSGMNLAFIVSIIMLLGRKKGVYIAAIAGVAAFMAISGFSASVVRAGIMQIAALIAVLFGRESDSFSSLALSLLVLLVINPFAAADIGLQFSFASVVGILTVGKRLDKNFKQRFSFKNKYVEKPIKAALSMAAVTLSAQISTIPLTIVHFKSISVVAVLANLMIFWAVSALFIIAVFALLVSAVWYWLGLVVAAPSWILVSYIEGCIDLLFSVPFAVFGTDSKIIVFWAFYSYISVFLLYKLGTKRVLLKSAGIVLASLAVAIALSSYELYNTFEVRVLSVGNGQCIVITNGGKTAVVDCDSRSPGRAANVLVKSLKERNITSIDLLILTSLHTENTSSADDLLGQFKIKTFMLPSYGGERDFARYLENKAAREDIIIASVVADTVITLGDMVFNIYIPPSGGTSRGCAAVRVECGGASVLILGELEPDVQDYVADTRYIPAVDAVVAGKNGANKATSPKILEKYGVKYVIISNSGLSDEKTLSGMTEFGARILSTEIQGDIKLRFRNGRIKIN